MNLPSRQTVLSFLSGAASMALVWGIFHWRQSADAGNPGDSTAARRATPGAKSAKPDRPDFVGAAMPSEAPGGPTAFGEGATLSMAAKREFGMSQEQAMECQALFRSIQDEITKLVAASFHREQSQEDPEGGNRVYVFETDPNLTQRLEKKLEEGLTDIVGENAARRLTGEIKGKNEFLRLARSNLFLRFYPREEGRDDISVSYEFRNPATDEYAGGGRGGWEGVKKILGLNLSAEDLEGR